MAELRGALTRLAVGAARCLLPAILLYALGATGVASAQSVKAPSDIPPSILNSLSPDQVQQILQQLPPSGSQSRTVTTLQPAAMPSSTKLEPAPQSGTGREKAPSRLEELMSGRAGQKLRQFGYDQLAGGQPVSSVQLGAIQDSYILGTGDQLDVMLRGQENNDYAVTVDRDGRVTLPKLSPIGASGVSLGDFRSALENAVRRAYISTKVYVTVTQVRQISVLVVGNVRNPGQQTLTGLSTVLDALNLAGGVRRAGTLRNIMIARGDRVIHVDLYAFLTSRHVTSDLTIAQGDRIVVPGLGATVAITGSVRRPGIYELPPGSRAISERGLVDLAEGTELPGVYRDSILTIQPDGKQRFVDATNRPGATVKDGEILFVQPAVNYSSGQVTLQGSVRLPGIYSLDKAKTLHDLLPSAEALEPVPYMLLGVVIRVDPQSLQRVIIPFSPLHVLDGSENLNLVNDDSVTVLTLSGMKTLVKLITKAEANDGTIQSALRPHSDEDASSPCDREQVKRAVPDTTLGDASETAAPKPGPCLQLPVSKEPGSAQEAGDAATNPSPLGQLSDADMRYIARALTDYTVTLTGAVRDSGTYLIAPGTTLADVLGATGGLDTDADTSQFEVTSTEIDNRTGRSTTNRRALRTPPAQYRTIVLHRLDSVNFHHVYTDRLAGSVSLSGEVRYPGTYSLLRGERLSEVLVRAGGLSDVAYPYGTVFLRKSLAQQETAANNRMAGELQLQMTREIAQSTGTRTGGGGSDQNALLAIEGFVQSIKNQPVVGRMVVIADPSVLAANPQGDPMLEPGDTIYIPQRPSTVSVIGAVMQPGNYQFAPSATIGDYIDQAGGYDTGAEDDMTFVVYPDGTARRVDQSWLHFSSAAIPPGSTIYVPRDLFPLNWQVLTQTVSQIFQSLAVSAASLAVVTRNN